MYNSSDLVEDFMQFVAEKGLAKVVRAKEAMTGEVAMIGRLQAFDHRFNSCLDQLH